MEEHQDIVLGQVGEIGTLEQDVRALQEHLSEMTPSKDSGQKKPPPALAGQSKDCPSSPDLVAHKLDGTLAKSGSNTKAKQAPTSAVASDGIQLGGHCSLCPVSLTHRC